MKKRGEECGQFLSCRLCAFSFLLLRKFLLWCTRCSSSEFLDESSVVERTTLDRFLSVLVVGVGDKNLLGATHNSIAVGRDCVDALQTVYIT